MYFAKDTKLSNRMIADWFLNTIVAYFVKDKKTEQ